VHVFTQPGPRADLRRVLRLGERQSRPTLAGTYSVRRFALRGQATDRRVGDRWSP